MTRVRLLHPKSSEIRHFLFFFIDSRRVPWPWDFSSGSSSSFIFFSESVFGMDMSLRSQVEESWTKKRRISIVARVSQGEK